MKKLTGLLLSFCLAAALFCIMTSCADTSENTTSDVKTVSSPKTTSKDEADSSKLSQDAFAYAFDSETRTVTISLLDQLSDKKAQGEYVEYEKIKHPEHIVIGKGVRIISDYCFAFSCEGNTGKRRNYNDRIKTVSIPDTVIYIGTDAFSQCKKLEKINIPDSVKSLGEMSTFAYCESLKKITIPGSVKKLPPYVFSDCKNLKKVTLKNGIQKISQNVFFNCDKLSSIIISDTVTVIEDAFSHCNSLKSIKLPKKLKTIKSQTFYSCKKLEKVTIQNNVTEIQEKAFDNCKSLKSIIIPESVTKIGEKAFGYVLKYKPSRNNSYIDVPIKDFTIKGYKGSAAEKYAKKNGFKFVALD